MCSGIEEVPEFFESVGIGADVHPATLPDALHEAGTPQLFEVVRHGGLADVEFLGEYGESAAGWVHLAVLHPLAH